KRENKKQLAPWDTRAPSPERTQAWDNRGRSHSRIPHDRSGNWSGLLHRGLLRLHSQKRKMFEQPPESSGPAFGIASPADGIESEANAKNSSDSPVGDGMAAEVQENPAHDHGSDGGRDSNVPTAPLRGKDKRPQARQSAPNFQPRWKAGQRSCVSETSLTHSCLRYNARAAIIESESVFHNDVGWSRASSPAIRAWLRSEEHTSELQSPDHLVCRLLLEKKKKNNTQRHKNYHARQ